MENVKAKNKMAAVSLILPVLLLIGILLQSLESVVLADKVHIFSYTDKTSRYYRT